MKTILTMTLLLLSAWGHAQGLSPYAGDYILKSALIGVCNSNARVETLVAGLSVVNPDQRDNRGWSSIKLIPGEKSFTLSADAKTVVRISFKGSTAHVERTTLRFGSEVAYSRDQYAFSTKSFVFHGEIETRGNTSGWGSICSYEKK